jgi:hypothetical protein
MIYVKIDLRELNREINKIKEVNNKQLFKQALDETLYSIAEDVKRKIQNKFVRRTDLPQSEIVKSIKDKVFFRLPKSLPPPLIGKRTGRLDRSIKIIGGRYLTPKTTHGIAYEGKKARMSYYIYLDKEIAPYVEAQEDGAIIRAKGRFLTIPISPISYGKSPTRFSNTIATNKFIFKKIRKGLYQPLYLLVKQVRLPARHFIKTSLKEVNIDKFIDNLKLKLRNIL